MQDELHHLKTEPGFTDILKILWHCRKILINSGKTYRQFLERFHFKNERLIEILDIFSSFSGLSGNRCASLLTACAMMTTLKGSFRPGKGFIEFPNLLKKEFVVRGGEMMMQTSVTRILVQDGVARGVELSDGTQIKGQIIVSTADSSVTYGKMIGQDKLASLDASFARKAREMEMSPSALAIHLGLDDKIDLKEMGFDCGYNVLTTGRTTHYKMFDCWEKGELLQSDEEFHLAVISPSAMTGGKNNLVIHVVPAPAEPWITLRNKDYDLYTSRKMAVADFYIRKVEEYMIPRLRDHIILTDVATPATYARYIGSPTGSNYDMLPVPGNFGKNRLRTRTPIKNLFVPKFSHGIWPSLQAGLQVVDMISGNRIMGGNSTFCPSQD
jgi:prolycopene isomerase